MTAAVSMTRFWYLRMGANGSPKWELRSPKFSQLDNQNSSSDNLNVQILEGGAGEDVHDLIRCDDA